MSVGAAPVRLALDIQATQSLDYPDRGIARYVQGLALALLDVPGLVRALLLNPAMPFPGTLHHRLLRSPLLTWNTASVMRRLREQGPLAYHLMSPMELGPPVETVLPDQVFSAAMPLITTLYDLVPLRDPQRHFLSPQIEERYRVRVGVYRGADLVLALSEGTRRDGIELLGLDPARVVSIGGGVSRFFAPAAEGDHPRARLREQVAAIGGDYLLYVSGTGARKNTERLIDAYGRLAPQLRSGLQLVIACRLEPEVEQRWRARAVAAGLAAGELVLTGFVDDETLRDLYRCARLLVFASEYEGYGLPIAEAIACGCPAITASTSASPEVLDMPESVFDPHDVADMARCMERALADAGYLERLRRRGAERLPLWTWDAVAARAVAAMQRLPRAQLTAAAPRLRVALVGDPQSTPAVAAVVPALAERCRLDVYRTGVAHHSNGNGNGHTASAVTVRPAADLLRSGAAGGYDAVIYAVPGRAQDGVTLELARRHPGIVWFTGTADCSELTAADAAGLVTGLRGETGTLRGRIVALPLEPEPADPMPAAGRVLAAELREMYGDRAPAIVLDDLAPPDDGSAAHRPAPVLTPERAWRFGLLCTAELARDARAVVAASDDVARRIRLDLGPLTPVALHIRVAAGSPSAIAAALLGAAASVGAP